MTETENNVRNAMALRLRMIADMLESGDTRNQNYHWSCGGDVPAGLWVRYEIWDGPADEDDGA